MLESTVWRQYNGENNFRELLSEFTHIDILDLIEDEKELKLFAMDSAKMDDEKIKNEFSYSDEDLQKAKFKLYKKFKQDKTRLSFRIHD